MYGDVRRFYKKRVLRTAPALSVLAISNPHARLQPRAWITELSKRFNPRGLLPSVRIGYGQYCKAGAVRSTRFL